MQSWEAYEHVDCAIITFATEAPYEKRRSATDLFLISLSTLLFHVSFGHPMCLLQAGVHRNATLGMESFSLQRACPIQCHRRCLICVDSGVVPVLRWSSLFVMEFGQKSGDFCGGFCSGRRPACSSLTLSPSSIKLRTTGRRGLGFENPYFCCLAYFRG